MRHGHVKISRKAYESDPFWTEKREFSRWEAWEWLIQAATWKKSMRVVGMTTIPLERGEVVASVRHLSSVWGWKRSRVHVFLRLLTSLDRITGQRETPAGTVYLLVNYDTYQTGNGGVPDSKPDTEADRSRTPAGQGKAVKQLRQESTENSPVSQDFAQKLERARAELAAQKVGSRVPQHPDWTDLI